jgi:hypothetical protein
MKSARAADANVAPIQSGIARIRKSRGLELSFHFNTRRAARQRRVNQRGSSEDRFSQRENFHLLRGHARMRAPARLKPENR